MRAAKTTPPDDSSWTLVALARATWLRLEAGWEELAREQRSRWAWTFGLGLVLCGLLCVGLTLAARMAEEAGWLAWDEHMLRRISELSWLSFNTGMWVEAPGSALVLWPLMIFAAGVQIWRGHPLRAMAFFPGYALVEPLVFLGWGLWARARPQFIAESIATPDGVLSHSFPSGHTAHSVYAFGLLFWFWWRASRQPAERALGLVVGGLIIGAVSLGRLRVGSHWPSDIFAAWLVGGAWLGVNILALHLADRAPGAAAIPSLKKKGIK